MQVGGIADLLLHHYAMAAVGLAGQLLAVRAGLWVQVGGWCAVSHDADLEIADHALADAVEMDGQLQTVKVSIAMAAVCLAGHHGDLDLAECAGQLQALDAGLWSHADYGL